MCHQRYKLTREFPAFSFTVCVSPSFRTKKGWIRITWLWKGKKSQSHTDQARTESVEAEVVWVLCPLTPFLFASPKPTPLEMGQNVPSAYKQLYEVGPSNPGSFPSEVGRESTMNSGHLNLNSAGPGTWRPLESRDAALTWSPGAARAARTWGGRSEAPPWAGAETRRGTRRVGERGGSRGAPGRARRSWASGSAGQTAVPGGEHRKEGASLNGVTIWTLFLRFLLNGQMHLNSI